MQPVAEAGRCRCLFRFKLMLGFGIIKNWLCVIYRWFDHIWSVIGCDLPNAHDTQILWCFCCLFCFRSHPKLSPSKMLPNWFEPVRGISFAFPPCHLSGGRIYTACNLEPVKLGNGISHPVLRMHSLGSRAEAELRYFPCEKNIKKTTWCFHSSLILSKIPLVRSLPIESQLGLTRKRYTPPLTKAFFSLGQDVLLDWVDDAECLNGNSWGT